MLKLGISHLSEPRFNHNFQSSINHLCSCSLEIESTTHFLLHYHHFLSTCSTFLNSTNEVLGSITNHSFYFLVHFGDQNLYAQDENSYIINTTIKYLVDS